MAELKLVVMDLPSIKYEYVYEGFKELTDQKDCEVIILPPGTPRETMIKEASEADGIVFCYELVDEAFLDQMKKPKIFSRTGIGMNNIDIPACTKRGILVANVRDPQTVEVANHVSAFVLALDRSLVKANKLVREGVWAMEPIAPIWCLTGMVFASYGFGRIAKATTKRMKAFGMEVIACDPYVSAEEMSEYGVRKVEAEELITTADFLSLHLPYTKETEKIVDADVLKKMKKTAYLINTARGGLVDEEALVEALKTGEIAGAGLDTLSTEHPTPDMPIFSCENAIITPHAGWYSEEANVALMSEAAKNVADFLLGKPVKNMCNPEVLEGKGE